MAATIAIDPELNDLCATLATINLGMRGSQFVLGQSKSVLLRALDQLQAARLRTSDHFKKEQLELSDQVVKDALGAIGKIQHDNEVLFRDLDGLQSLLTPFA